MKTPTYRTNATTPTFCSSPTQAKVSPTDTFSLNNFNIHIAFINSCCLVTKQILIQVGFWLFWFLVGGWLVWWFFVCLFFEQIFLFSLFEPTRPFLPVISFGSSHDKSELILIPTNQPRVVFTLTTMKTNQNFWIRHQMTQQTLRPSSASQLHHLLCLQLSVLVNGRAWPLSSLQSATLSRTALGTLIQLSFTP